MWAVFKRLTLTTLFKLKLQIDMFFLNKSFKKEKEFESSQSDK